ncbi:TRAP transporter substrate-binding protein DctP [Halomonas sp. MCCC 1A11036]|uniref:TRAP transporter substrate-binding protein DctP n=1 Tax=Billgrantia zhangzhouensis TaxID=2733481 RepID=A0ABS9AK38_9GAMM|nr:TRAP transporter substrate-binding protein DctP [Halomonas zhangzhouensis]MCE8022081.1 TRAP transporter substrate-binding protein DctP [Halomonas zhangzhouensis]
MMRTINKTLLPLAVALASQAVFASEILRFSHSYTEGDARHEWAKFIAERVEEKTDGEVRINLYPNQEIFRAQAQHGALRQGLIDLTIYPLPWLSGMVPLAEIGALPGLVADPTDGLVWRERTIWPMLAEAIESTGVILAGSGWAMASIGSTGDPVALPEDVAGLRMRGLGGASEQMLNANGATITSLPASELYQALQTGVLTGVLTQYASFEGYNLHEVIDYLQVGPGYVGGMHAILLSAGLEQKVGSEHFAHIMEAVQESEVWFAEKMIEDSQRIAEEFERQGVQLYELSNEELAAWIENARETAWPYFIERVPEGAAALEAVNTPL